MPFGRAKKSSSIEQKIETEIESLAPLLKIESSALRRRIPGIAGVRTTTRPR